MGSLERAAALTVAQVGSGSGAAVKPPGPVTACAAAAGGAGDGAVATPPLNSAPECDLFDQPKCFQNLSVSKKRGMSTQINHQRNKLLDVSGTSFTARLSIGLRWRE